MPVTQLPERCDACGLRGRTLFDTFVNGAGCRRRCGCRASPHEVGAPRAYLGPYPITDRRRSGKAFSVHLAEDARQ